MFARSFASGAPEDESDLWLYDVASDRARRLTSDGRKSVEVAPKFLTEDEVAYVVGDSLRVLDLHTGDRREIFRADRAIGAYDWSPDGRLIAFISENDFSGNQRPAGESFLSQYDVETKTIRELRDLGPPCDCDGGGDPAQVEWSPDGSVFLALGGWGVREQRVYVIDAKGDDVVEPFVADDPRWSSDGMILASSLALQSSSSFYGRDPKGGWIWLDPAMGARRTIPMSPLTSHPSIAPDGRRIAMLGGGNYEWMGTDIYLFDVETGDERRIASGFRDPVWLTRNDIAVTRIERCHAPDYCLPMGWRAKGAVKINVETGRMTPMELETTLAAPYQLDIRYA